MLEAHEQDVRKADWEKCPGLCRWHAGEKPKKGRSFEGFQRNIQHPSFLQYEAQSGQVCLRSDNRKVPRIHCVLEGYQGQPRQDPGYNRNDTPKEHEGSTSLNSKVAALNRFVPRATNKCLPFFCTLKKSFEWVPKCQ